MDSLNFIFGLRAINTPVEEEKHLTCNPAYDDTPETNQNKELRFNEQVEEDFTLASVNEREIHEVIF